MKKYDVSVVGSLNFDIIFKQNRLPKIGETMLVDNVTLTTGGKGANQAVQCSKLELKTTMLGLVGNDYFGEKIKSNLKEYGVNIDYLNTTNTVTGLGVVNSFSDGELLSTVYSGANYEFSNEYINQITSVIQKSKIIILQMEIPNDIVEKIIKLAHKEDCYIILNAAPSVELSSNIIKLVDCFIVNEEEANYYSKTSITNLSDAKKASEILYKKVQGLIIITLGSLGSILYNGKEKVHITPHPTTVKETTGAGDSYVGAVAYGIHNKFDMKDIGIFASKVSSVTIRNIGAQESMPGLNEIKKLKDK